MRCSKCFEIKEESEFKEKTRQCHDCRRGIAKKNRDRIDSKIREDKFIRVGGKEVF